MEQVEEQTKEPKITKKGIRKAIAERLAGALIDYKVGLNEKKFNNKVKKAVKLFEKDITKAAKRIQKEDENEYNDQGIE